MNSNKLTTSIAVYRRPRKGFIPPRRVGENENSESSSDTTVPKKKRDLSPLFSKIIKVLDERNGSEQECAAGKFEVDLTGQDVAGEACHFEEPPMVNVKHGDSYYNDGEAVGDGDSVKHGEERGVSSLDLASSSRESVFKKPKLLPGVHSNFQLGMDYEDESLSQSQLVASQSQPSTTKRYYGAVFAKISTRKHKKWEGDGYIIVSNEKSVTLKNTNGKVMESSNNYKLTSEILEDGKVFKLGSKEVQIVEELGSDPFAVAQNVTLPTLNPTAVNAVAKLPTPLANKPFVSPFAPGTVVQTEKPNKNASKPMFDPDAPDAVVMPVLDPSENVRVVVDPHLSRHLRHHQREGVTFLYKCVMDKYYNGAILGDEMGLGKTLQCITLLWTLMKQGPYQRKEIIKRAVIVCPSSLVNNWEKEFHRWLGHERIKVFAVNSDHPLKHCPPQCPVIIMSYEMATRSEDALKKMRFDLLVCDEAHKIKNKNGQAYVFLSKLACKKRILLTGTPVQNDLMELYALVDFANPGVLGTESEFRREYEKPIEKYQESHSSIIDKQMGQCKALQLNNILNNFFLRRTHSVMLRYLPPRVTSVVICKPSKLQVNLYKRLLSLNIVQDCVTGSGNCSAPLSVILALKKLCNHPNLVHPKSNGGDKIEESIYASLGSEYPSGHRLDLLKIEDSGKMKVLTNILKSLEGQKVVVVSHYTQTLDLLEELCKTFNFQFKRLDGSTLAKQRQQIVDQFNSGLKEFIFLLSSKAGGLGLNLQGAANIILYDIDWNPAHDIQAMSRCWRPGQKKITNIYRLITSGTIEERIFHRQIAKQDLSGSVMDLLLSNSSVKFSPQDLKDIFNLYEGEDCLTHDLIDCDCGMDGSLRNLNDSGDNLDSDNENIPTTVLPPRKKLKSISTMAELHSWEHHGPPFLRGNLAQGLQNATGDIKFIFCSKSLPSDESE